MSIGLSNQLQVCQLLWKSRLKLFMKRSTSIYNGMLLLTAVIWGLAFVAQCTAMDHIGPYCFNAVRFFVGACSLAPLILWRRRKKQSDNPVISRSLIIGGVFMGLLLFAGISLQQVGLQYTTVGNAGFISGLYIVLVPVIGLFIGEKTEINTWLGMVLALIGLYLLTMHGELSLNNGDKLMLGGTLFWALHVLLVGFLVVRHSALFLAVIQFIVCAGFSLVMALATEDITMEGIKGAWAAIAFVGFVSTGLAYALQLNAQTNTPAAHAALILSLAAVFAVLGGWVWLDETVAMQTLVGCGVMLTGMLVSQMDIRLLKRC